MAAEVGVNSYVSTADMTTYLTGHVNAAAWDTVADADAALISAARRIDQEQLAGTRVEQDQALAWPRYGVYDEDDRLISSEIIPERVKRAQMELALAMAAGEFSLSDTGLEGFESVRVGPLEVRPRTARKAGALPQHVVRELMPFLVNAPGTVRLLRG